MKLICLIIFQTILANTDQRLKLILQPFGELRCIVVWKLGGSSFLSRRGTGGLVSHEIRLFILIIIADKSVLLRISIHNIPCRNS